MHDIVKRLRKYADEYAPVPVEDLRAAADEIERLHARQAVMRRRGRMDHSAHYAPLAQSELQPDDESTAVIITPRTERFDEIERRIALLESNVRRTAYRIDAAAAAMRDVASRESVHPSVRYVADNLRLAFVCAPTDEVDITTGWMSDRKDGGHD